MAYFLQILIAECCCTLTIQQTLSKGYFFHPQSSPEKI